MPQPSFLRTSHCVFASGAHLSREQALLAAARLHVKPASLTGALPTCALVTDDRAEAERLLADARAVDVEAWALSGADVEATDRASRVTLFDGGVDVTTASRVRRVVFARLAAWVDLRWKRGASESRVLAFAPDDAAPVVALPDELSFEGPSRQGAMVQLTSALQQAVTVALKARALVLVSAPHQLGVPPQVPAQLVALALTQHVARKASRR